MPDVYFVCQSSKDCIREPRITGREVQRTTYRNFRRLQDLLLGEVVQNGSANRCYMRNSYPQGFTDAPLFLLRDVVRFEVILQRAFRLQLLATYGTFERYFA